VLEDEGCGSTTLREFRYVMKDHYDILEWPIAKAISDPRIEVAILRI